MSGCGCGDSSCSTCCGSRNNGLQSFLKFSGLIPQSPGTYGVADAGTASPVTALVAEYPVPEPFRARSLSVRVVGVAVTSITFTLMKNGVPIVGGTITYDGVLPNDQRLVLPNNGVFFGRTDSFALRIVVDAPIEAAVPFTAVLAVRP